MISLRNNRKIIGLLVVTVIAVVALIWNFSTKDFARLKSYSVEKSDIDIRILSTGTVLPENRLEIKAPIAGRIDEVLIQEGAKLKKGQILAWMSSTERAAMMDAARARGPEELKKWEEIYKPTPILAPLPGTLILRNIEPGQTITSTEVIFAMSDRLTVKAQVDETDIAKIKLKQMATIVLDAYPDISIEAEVDQIAFEAKTVNNVTTYLVDVLPKKTPDFMRSGMTANVTFQIERKKDVLTLSNEAIQVVDGKTQVLLKQDNTNTPVARTITTGATDGKKTEIVEGLEESDIVVRLDSSNDPNQKKKGSNPFSPFGGRSGGGNRGR